MWAKIITIKRTKDLNYFSLCALNLFNTQVSQFELNYWNKWTFPRHSNLRCTCIYTSQWNENSHMCHFFFQLWAARRRRTRSRWWRTACGPSWWRCASWGKTLTSCGRSSRTVTHRTWAKTAWHNEASISTLLEQTASRSS